MKHIKTFALVILCSITILSCSKDKDMAPLEDQSFSVPSDSFDSPINNPKKHSPIDLVSE